MFKIQAQRESMLEVVRRGRLGGVLRKLVRALWLSVGYTLGCGPDDSGGWTRIKLE